MKKFKPSALYIELTPRVFPEDEQVWNGEVEVNLIMDKKSPLDITSQQDLLNLGQMVAATLGLMEEDKQIVARLQNFIDKKLEPNTMEKKDNIIYFDFKQSKKEKI
tara:strand:+ start:70 stop:387 length:318 start_codon:yes stop_codon:yes gene_type:complete